MRDALVYPRSKTVRAALGAGLPDQIDHFGFVITSSFLAAAMILLTASVILARLG